MSNDIKVDNVSIENALIGFRNFSGKEGRYNTAGDRNFVIFLTKELAEQMLADGWNVRTLKPRTEESDEDEGPRSYLQVKVGFGAYPPKIILINGETKTNIDEDSLSMLDWVDIKTADVIVRPYSWSVNGKTGVKAYVKALYITMVEDKFAVKYDFQSDPEEPTSVDVEETLAKAEAF